jgi:co-chaperonin GroES (HSP10)|tara:strand:+ start:707 stop:1093 length:387 start_codon:yes stop_codon:yes gene_type:complete
MNKVAELDINEVDEQELEAQLPRPVGYRILIAMPEIEETFADTKVLKTTTIIHQEHIMSIIGLVLDMGDQAYSDVERFGDTPWCKVGDYVMFRANTGTRFKVGGVEYRLMNDDSIEAVVSDPRGVSRA